MVNIEANNLAVDRSYASWGIVTLAGGTAAWDVEAWIYLDDEATSIYGEYDDEGLSLYLTDLVNNPEDYFMPTVSSAKLEKTAQGDLFTAVAIGDDGTTYNVTLSLFVPDEAKDTVVLDFGPVSYFKYYASDGR